MQKGGKRLLARKPSDLSRRLLALGLVCALTAPMWSMGFSLAADGDGASACPHHQVHTPECGYREPAEGSPCTHEHDDACGYDELTGAPCAHVHDEACGYVPADEGPLALLSVTSAPPTGRRTTAGSY